MNISSHQPKIIVVGSCAIDLVLYVDKVPGFNETVIASNSETFFGGKGANEAVGVSRLGASSYLMGCVGMDPSGQQIMRHLVEEDVNIDFVSEIDDEETGKAYVASDMGRHSIIVVPAANYSLTNSHILEAEKYFQTCDLVLLQLEVPLEVNEFVVSLAKKYDKKVGIYAAPACHLPSEMMDQLDFIICKSNEISKIFGTESSDSILKKYPNKLFIRDEDNSTTYFNGSVMKNQRNSQLPLQYNMGMGDAFTSGFSVALCHGNSVEEAVDFGNFSAMKVAQKRGAQTGLPYLKDLV